MARYNKIETINQRRTKKVAIITCRTSAIIGFRLDMIRRFQDLGHSVTVIGDEQNGPWLDMFCKLKIQYFQYDIERNGMNIFKDYKAYKQLKSILSEVSPDIVFTYLLKPNLYGSLAARVVKQARVYNLVTGLGSVIRGEGLKNNIMRRAIFTLSKLGYKHSSKVIFQNPDDRALMLENNVIQEAQATIINGSGVPLDRYPYTPPPEVRHFLFVGRLLGDKGIREFFQASRVVKEQYPDAEFHVLGRLDNNPSSVSSQELDEVVDDGVITYHGTQEDVLPFLQACSVFVLPSYFEGTPRSVLESMSVGRMIITTNAPGCRETVLEGVNGYLVEPRDSKSLESAMLKACRSSELRNQMGLESRRIAEEKYDVNIVNESIVDIMNLKKSESV